MSLPRISAISFLNTAPLMWDFEHTDLSREYEIGYTIPSLCAEALRAGDADIGLIPAVTYLTIPDLTIIPGVAIAAHDRVRSILLVSRKPPEEIKTVAADTSSRTSVVLCDLLFRRHFPAHRDGSRVRQFTRHEPNLDAMLERFDAALLIGDSALRVDAPRYCVFDLAHEWRAMTGKPFCFAFWAVRKRMARPKMIEHFARSRDHGLEPGNLDILARQWAPRVGISEAEVRSYLTENIHYHLDQPVLDGLWTFFDMGQAEGLLPPAKLTEAPFANVAR
jgi:chorismate dehydratase